MTTITLKEKFIGYVDILGYSAMTRAAEAGTGFTFADMDKILAMLGSQDDRAHFQKYGPTTCPQAPHIQKDMDFQIAQVWDSVVVSTEVSPAGAINLVSHCWGACINLLTKGVMCRGYIKRGKIFHDGNRIFGSGHVDTVAREKNVSFFKQDADERGTPFIEVDQEIVSYVADQPDRCVKEMFGRMILTQDNVTALFPIKRLSHSFIIGGFGMPKFDPEKEKHSNNNLRKNLHGLKTKLSSFVDSSDVSVVRKLNHYLRAIDEQLKMCDKTDEMIDKLGRPFGAR